MSAVYSSAIEVATERMSTRRLHVMRASQKHDPFGEHLVCFNVEPHFVELGDVYSVDGRRCHTGCWLNSDVRLVEVSRLGQYKDGYWS